MTPASFYQVLDNPIWDVNDPRVRHLLFLGGQLKGGVLDVEDFTDRFERSILPRVAATPTVMLDFEPLADCWQWLDGAGWKTAGQWMADIAGEEKQILRCIEHIRSRCECRLLVYGLNLFATPLREVLGGTWNFSSGRTPENRRRFVELFPDYVKFLLRPGGMLAALDGYVVEDYFRENEPQTWTWFEQRETWLGLIPKPRMYLFWPRPHNHTTTLLLTQVRDYMLRLAATPGAINIGFWRDGADDPVTDDVRDVVGFVIDTVNKAREA